MKGFTNKEIELLLSEAKIAEQSGRSLSFAFETVAQKTGRAKGSVRNFYYTLMKSNVSNSIKNMLDESGLKVEKNVSFTKDEERELVEKVLLGVKDGKSVRKTIISLAKGDEKTQLRIQNKYRNLAKSKPSLIAETAKTLGMENNHRLKPKEIESLAPYIKKVSSEIDKMVEKIKDKYKKENQKLKREIEVLKQKISDLTIKPNKTITEFFSDSKKSV